MLKQIQLTFFVNFFLIFCVFLTLTGCMSCVNHCDGPLPYSVDVSKIPNAKPKVEPLSKYGNQPYHVFGKQYAVMKSSKNYVAQGTASWYGTKFHHHRTSSGEQYDMLGMTAAHKSLPLPTYVEVTNLENGRKVIVKVNDRGPFSGNRLIDLSYAAAKKLGMIPRGTAKVEVRAINPITEPSFGRAVYYAKNKIHSSLSMAKNTKNIYLQVGAFQNKSHALKLQNQLLAFKAFPVKITHSATTHLYHVQIGPIKDETMMVSINKKLKSIGISSTRMVV